MEFLNVETTLFNIIGWTLLLGSAVTVIVPVLVWIGNLICSCLWEFVDEGDTPYEDKFTSIYLMEVVEGEVVNCGCGTHPWIISKGSKILDASDGLYYYESHPSDFGLYYYGAYPSAFFESEKVAQSYLDKNREKIRNRNPDVVGPSFKSCAVLIPISASLGLGFMFIPTITLVAGSALLSLYAMRWARRGVKLAKKVKSSLDSHIIDKDAHK